MIASVKQPNAIPTGKKRRFSADDFELLLLSLPTTIWYILFSYLPIFGIVIAFKKYKPNLGNSFLESLYLSNWSGFDNFKFLFMTPDSALFIRNTLLYNALFITIGVLLPTTLAILITQLYSTRMAKTCQTAMFFPHFMSWVVIGYFVFAFLNPEKGFFNNTLERFGMEKIQWYLEKDLWPFILVFMNTWKGMGYGMVVYLAALSGIDTALYEAAIIDGAGKWQQTRYITIPMLRPVMIIMFILSVGNIFRSDFGLFFQVPRDSGPLSEATLTIDVYVYKSLMRLNNIAFASSAAFTQSVCGLATILIANAIVRRLDPDSAMF